VKCRLLPTASLAPTIQGEQYCAETLIVRDATRLPASIATCRKGIALPVGVSFSLMTAILARENLPLVGGPKNEMGSAPCQTHWVAAFGTNHVVVRSETVRRLLLLK
jgi:hypothetical protein